MTSSSKSPKAAAADDEVPAEHKLEAQLFRPHGPFRRNPDGSDNESISIEGTTEEQQQREQREYKYLERLINATESSIGETDKEYIGNLVQIAVYASDKSIMSMSDEEAKARYYYAYLRKGNTLEKDSGSQTQEDRNAIANNHLSAAIDYFIAQDMKNSDEKFFKFIEKAAKDRPPHPEAEFYCNYRLLKQEQGLSKETKNSLTLTNAHRYLQNKTWWSSLSLIQRIGWVVVPLFTLGAAWLAIPLMSDLYAERRLVNSKTIKDNAASVTPTTPNLSETQRSSSAVTTQRLAALSPISATSPSATPRLDDALLASKKRAADFEEQQAAQLATFGALETARVNVAIENAKKAVQEEKKSGHTVVEKSAAHLAGGSIVKRLTNTK